MPYKFTVYPQILPDKHRQKNHRLFAKGTGETSAGTAMDATATLD